MEEQRRYFRVNNTGQIHATINGSIVRVIEISAGGVALEHTPNIPSEGHIEVKFHFFSMFLEYKLLRTVGNRTVLVFVYEDDIEKLLEALKSLRDMAARE